MALQQFGEQADMLGIQVRDEHETHSSVGGKILEQFGEGFQTTRRRADSYDRKKAAFGLFRLFERWKSWRFRRFRRRLRLDAGRGWLALFGGLGGRGFGRLLSCGHALVLRSADLVTSYSVLPEFDDCAAMRR